MAGPTPLFEKVPPQLDFPREEEQILALWRDRKVFQRSLEGAGPDAETFVFFEGPPTANGMPHNGHVLTRVVKDLFPRYKTMRGYRVPRKAGWDTHGLPVEVEVEKSLRIHGKAAIEAYGVEPFIVKCLQSVFRYTDEWARLTERVGFWVDLPSAYVTYHKEYVESVWWALSQLFEKGLLYQGHKVVWWWAQGGTALSSGEVGEGYRQVDDPSAYVAFPLVDTGEGGAAEHLLVWTTTPWTLPSNMFAAVHQDFTYAVVERSAEHAGAVKRLVVAEGLLEELRKKLKDDLKVLRTVSGKELVGRRYRPPFAFLGTDLGTVPRKDGTLVPRTWRVLAADFVTLDAGTGIVHVAPAFGEDDFNAFKKDTALLADPAQAELLCAVKPDGTFDERMGKYAGRWVKDGDKELLTELKEAGLLVHTETYRHDYPFCPRSDQDPLIQYARPAWYIRTTALIHRARELNQGIHWLPPHIKDGRFGDFLANNVDWALSRERWWGTPLNVWVNDVSGKMEAPASVDAILAKNPRAFDAFHDAKKKDPSLSEHLLVHKPWIDQVTWQNPGEEGTYRRVPEVIDCWFDSGCMQFAQWGYPHRGQEAFKASFPANFISEAIDQTRGWFYSLLMVGTLLFDKAPYETCIVLGHVSDREGKKESKSKGNYTPPEVILDRVRLEFAVVDGDAVGVTAEKGTVLVCREDLEGLDLQEGATVRLYAAGGASGPAGAESPALDVVVKVGKKLRRRIAVVHAADRQALRLTPTASLDVKPVEVPWLPTNERVWLEDPTTPAPGADAFRWFFYASSPPWSATRHSLSNVRALQKDFLVKLRHVWSFFVIYASIDGFTPASPGVTGPGASITGTLSELDRFLLSELALTTRGVTADLDAYDIYGATQKLGAFVETLSNWYVRRSRERFWRGGALAADGDKRAAYETLYEALVTLAKLAAPFVPFMAEAMFQNLAVEPDRRVGAKGTTAPDSVHLVRFPEADVSRIDEALSAKMAAVRNVVSLGLQVRTSHKLKVRQPLRAAHVILARAGAEKELADAEGMIREELNVLSLTFVPPSGARSFVEYKLKPNFRTLGQRGMGREAQALKKSLANLGPAEAAALHGDLLTHGKVTHEGVELLAEDVEVSFETKAGFAAAGDRVGVVVLETTLDDELRDLGFLRELQNRLQNERKEQGLEYTDRVDVEVFGSPRVKGIVDRHASDLGREVLARRLVAGALDGAEGPARGDLKDLEVEGERVRVGLRRVEVTT